jgi:hypothetical protein
VRGTDVESNPSQDETMNASASRMKHQDPRLEAARKRLRESVGQADTFEAIREIVTNLLGCEEIGLFTLEQGKKHGHSRLLWSFGIDTERHATLESFEASALEQVLQGEFHVTRVAGENQNGHGHPPLRVFVPIRVTGRTVAVLVMLTLLPQKVGFNEEDLALVKLLSDETARALFHRRANAYA